MYVLAPLTCILRSWKKLLTNFEATSSRVYIYIYPIGMRPDLILPHSTPDPSALFQGKSTRSSLAVETCRPAYAARTTWHMFEDYSVNIGVRLTRNGLLRTGAILKFIWSRRTVVVSRRAVVRTRSCAVYQASRMLNQSLRQ